MTLYYSSNNSTRNPCSDEIPTDEVLKSYTCINRYALSSLRAS